MDHIDKKVDKKHLTHGKSNPDPITGAPGAHPIGTGVGGVGAAAVGAAIGALGGPVGAVVGATIGTVAGGVAGKAVAEKVNPTREDAFWRENFSKRPYVTKNDTYDTFRPAYEHGWTARERFAGKRFDDVEADLRTEWENQGYGSRMAWTRANLAVRDAWDRFDGPLPLGAI